MSGQAVLESPANQAPADRSRDMSAFLQRLWDGLEGWACLTIGSPERSQKGGYEIKRWRSLYFSPHDLSGFVERALAEATSNDVFLCPALRSTKDRTGGTEAPSRYVWADIDGEWNDERAQRWHTVRQEIRESMIVRSGHGRHLYVALTAPVVGDQLEAANKHLATAFGGDSKWASNALLRVPGTLNHKGRVLEQGDPLPVIWEQS